MMDPGILWNDLYVANVKKLIRTKKNYDPIPAITLEYNFHFLSTYAVDEYEFFYILEAKLLGYVCIMYT